MSMRSAWAEYAREADDFLPFYGTPLRQLETQAPMNRPWDPNLTAALQQYQSSLGLERTLTGEGAVIITGQQPALFTGPLYTVYKAITTIKLARRLSEQHGVPVVPVYWVGSEDHDFDEARSVHVLTRNHTKLTLTYAPDANIDGAPMHQVPIEPSLHDFVDEIRAEVPGSSAADDIAAFLHASLDESESLSDWVARMMARLFQDTELVFFSPHLEAARAVAVPILEREIKTPLESTRKLNDAAKALERIGFEPQLVKNDTECNFFVAFGQHRCKVLYEGGHFYIPEHELRHTEAEMLAMLHEEPARFSPNVALRCVVQQALFPAAAYVAGPGELAYWAQLKDVFAHFGMPMPAVYPRAKATLTTLKLNKLLAKTGLSIAELDAPIDPLIEKVMRNTSQHPAYRFAKEQRGAVEDALSGLVTGLEQHHQNAADMAKTLSENVATQLDRIERTILQEDEAKQAAAKQQLERLCVSLAPNRKPQERVYSIVSYLFEYGWDVIPWLMEHLDTAPFAANELEL